MSAAAAAVALLFALLLGVIPLPAYAHAHNGSVMKFFSNATVGSDDTVNGDLTVVFGDATIAGHVTGNVTVIGGSCQVIGSGTVDGDEHCAWSDAAGALEPLVFPAGSSAQFAAADRRLFVKIASNAVVVLVFLLFPMRMRFALDRVERHPGLAAAVGIAACIAVLPVALLLLFTIVGIPLIVLEIAGVFAAVWLGTGAAALLVGRRLCELLAPRMTPPPLAALLLGLIVISAAEVVPFIGWAVTALVWLVSLGAALLAWTSPAGAAGLFRRPPDARPPIGGPPMKSSKSSI